MRSCLLPARLALDQVLHQMPGQRHHQDEGDRQTDQNGSSIRSNLAAVHHDPGSGGVSSRGRKRNRPPEAVSMDSLTCPRRRRNSTSSTMPMMALGRKGRNSTFRAVPINWNRISQLNPLINNINSPHISCGAPFSHARRLCGILRVLATNHTTVAPAAAADSNRPPLMASVISGQYGTGHDGRESGISELWALLRQTRVFR